MKYLRDFNTMNDAKQSTLYSPYVLVIRDEKLVIYENMPHDKDEDFTDIPNNEIWYTTTDGETTETTNTIGLFSLKSMGLSSNDVVGDHCVMTFDKDITNIGEGAFNLCSKLTSVTIPNSVTNIGKSAFVNCKNLTSITIPNFVTNIGEGAFAYCSSLGSITIPNSVTSIGDHAFYECRDVRGHIGLTSVTIGNSVTNIGEGAFCNCTYLTSITCDALNPPTCGDECFMYVDKTIPLYVPEVSIDLYRVAEGWKDFFHDDDTDDGNDDTNDVTIPNNEIWYTTTNGEITKTTNADGINSLTSMGLTDNIVVGDHCVMRFNKDVTNIGNYAFYLCTNLTSVTIPNSVTYIGSIAFSACTNLTSVTIGNSVKSIGYNAFSSCPLASITIPNSVTSIRDAAFMNCNRLTSITIPNSVTEIGTNAFAGCSGFTSITCDALNPPTCGDECFMYVDKTIPLYVPETSINLYKVADGWKDFFHDVVITYTASDKLNISENAFGASISSHEFNDGTGVITLDNEDASIRDYAFSGCSGLTSITIPNSVTSIGKYAFSGCDGLTSVTIPNSVTNIGVGVFGHCYRLTSIVVESGNTNYDSRENCNAIIETSTNTLISGCKNTTIPNSVTSIGDHAFYQCSSLTSITIPNSVTSIGSSAFYYCTGLTSVIIPNSVTNIENYAFSNVKHIEYHGDATGSPWGAQSMN